MTNSDTYLSNLVRNTTYGLDLAFDMIEILKKAVEWQEFSMANYRLSQEEPEGTELFNAYWRAVCEADERSQGLLDAYQIISCRIVLNYDSAIKDEIRWIEDEFGLEN